MKKITLLLLTLLATPLLRAQTVYIISDLNKIYRINEDYTLSFVCAVELNESSSMDIAISPTGNFYVSDNDGVYQVDIQTGASTFLFNFLRPGNSGLVCGYDGIYSIDGHTNLVRYDFLTSEPTVVAYLGFHVTGDISFYKGNLIFTTYHENINRTLMKAYNPQTGVLSDIFCDTDFINFWGMATQHVGCDNETVMISSSYQELFTVDFQSQSYITTPLQFPEDLTINGLASTTEYLGSECEAQELTDLQCASLSTVRNLKQEVIVYPNPATDVLHFKNHDQLKSLTIYDVTGKEVKSVNNITSSLDIHDLTAGVYIIKLNTEIGYSMRKIVKK